MKKIFNFVLCAGAAFLAVTGCQKDMDTTSGSEARVVSFCATEMETKTQFGDKAGNKYPTLWTTNQKVLVNLSYKKGLELEVTPSDDGATATFNGDFSSVTEGPYTFMSVSPASAKCINFDKNTKTRVGVNILANQIPLANSVDERVQILVAKSEEFTEFPTSADLSYKHVVAYGKMTLENLGLEDGEKVSSVSLTASEVFAGHYYYYFHDLKEDDVVKTPEGTLESTASPSKTITLNTSSVENVWFACAPVDLSAGGTMEIVVTTDNGTYTKEVTFPASAGNFEAGKVASFTVNMNGIACVKQQSRWEKVTDVRVDWSGTYLIVAEVEPTNPRAWKLEAADKQANPLFLTVTDGRIVSAGLTNVGKDANGITTNSGDVELSSLDQYAVTIAKVDGGYSIMTPSGQYITNTTGTAGIEFKTESTIAATSITKSDDNTFRIENTKSETLFGWHNGNRKFNFFPVGKWDNTRSQVSFYECVEEQ